MQRESTSIRRLRQFAAIAVLWIFLGGFIILQIWPDLPRTKLQWFLLVVLGPPIYVLGEAVFGWLFSAEHGRKISDHQFSLLRIVLALFVILMVLGIVAFTSFVLKSKI